MVLFKEKSCSRKSGHTAEVLVFQQNMLQKKGHTAMVKKNHVQKKATAEVLVFEQNMLKKKRSHRYGFVSEQNMSKEQTTIPETCLFGTKECTKTKSGRTAMLFFPIKNVPK